MTADPQPDDEVRVTPSPVGEQRSDEEMRIFPKHIRIHFEKDHAGKLDFIRKTLRARHFTPTNERALVFVHRRQDAEENAEEFREEKADY